VNKGVTGIVNIPLSQISYNQSGTVTIPKNVLYGAGKYYVTYTTTFKGYDYDGD